MKKLYILAASALFATAAHSQVVISQVYGGGGNAGSVYKNDFVELFNKGNAAVTLTGYTLQYASATGAFNPENIQTLPTITIQPGKYFLIQEAQGTGGTTSLPTPDLVTTEADNFVILALSGTNGKLVLANNGTPVTAANGTNVVDFVGYGTASIFEGSAAVPALTNTTSALRASNGCQDSNDNAADFTTGDVAPRNSATAANLCTPAGVSSQEIAGLKLFPNPLNSGATLNITSNNASDKSVAIFDILGKQVFSGATVRGTVNTSNLTAGVYIVKITEGNKTATRKLVVQ